MSSYPKRAHTLLEVMLAAGLLSLLFLMHLLIFQSGLSSWHKVETQGSLLQQLQVAGSRWAQTCSQASGSSLSTESGAMALLSPVSSNQSASIDSGSGLIIWRSTRLFYQRVADKTFCLRSLDWPVPGFTGSTIDELDFGSGKHALSFYRAQGHILAGNIQLVEFTHLGRAWQLRLVAAQKRYGREQAEQLEIHFLATPRNF